MARNNVDYAKNAGMVRQQSPDPELCPWLRVIERLSASGFHL